VRKTSVSFRLLIGIAGLFLLQVLPIVGFYLFLFGASILSALLIHMFFLALFVESAFGRLPRVLAIVPVLAYGAYYWAYFEQSRVFAEEVAKLQSINVGKVFDFDSSRDSLVFTSASAPHRDFAADHAVPVSYIGHLSARLAPASKCAAMQSFDNGARARVDKFGPNAPCLLTRTETPPNRPVNVLQVDHASRMQRLLGINEPSTDIVVDGKLVGSLRKIVVRQISPYLWYVGCMKFTELECDSSFYAQQRDVIERDPPSADKARFDSPASILLGIPRYTDAEIKNFAGYPANAPIEELAQSPQ
jgi:hypothetical protein